MTPDELHSRRREIVAQAVQSGCVEECLRDLASLDSSAQTGRNAYYDFLNRFDVLYRLLKASEGQSGALKATIDLMIAALAAYRRVLAKAETESVS